MAFLDFFRKPTPQAPVTTPTRSTSTVHYRSAVMASAANRLTNNWYKQLRGPNREIESDLRAARALSRHLTYNSVYVARFLQLLRTNVNGPKGMQLIASNMGPDGN